MKLQTLRKNTMKKKLAALLLAALFIGSALQAQDAAKPALRTWKDSTGQFSIQATFVRVNGDQVVLQRTDKKEISLPLAKLSAADQQYVKSRLTPAPSGKNQQEAIAALEKLGAKTKKGDDGNLVSIDLTLKGKLTDADLGHLKEITSLKELTLTYTKITDQGLMHLKGLTNLKKLNLYGIKITDTGLGHLKGLSNLEELNLGGNRITDRCLVHLKGLTKLKQLKLINTLPEPGAISDAGVAELQKALPNCKIEH